jgi:hypothetical protein
LAVWDPTDSAIWTAPGTTKTRFGGEGTGWTVYYPYDWATNCDYRFCARLIRESPTTTLYFAYFADPHFGASSWKHLATIRRTVGVTGFRYLGSFLEDFGERSWIPRSFVVGNQWMRIGSSQLEWVDVRQALFNSSIGWSNPYTNHFDGDVVSVGFRLETGGDTLRDNVPGDVLSRPAGVRPQDLPLQPPMLQIAQRDGFPEVWVRGTPGQKYTIEASSNLVHWVKIISADSGVTLRDLDTGASGIQNRFYRARLWTGL